MLIGDRFSIMICKDGANWMTKFICRKDERNSKSIVFQEPFHHFWESFAKSGGHFSEVVLTNCSTCAHMSLLTYRWYGAALKGRSVRLEGPQMVWVSW